MADKNISSLPVAESLNDDSLLVAEQQGEAVSVRGMLLRRFAEKAAGNISKGEPGEPGKDFQILGYYKTFAELQASVRNPDAGDAYGIGTETPYDIYVYDGVNKVWVNNGPIQGPEGEPGKAFTYDDFTPEQLENLRGPAGKPTDDQVAEAVRDWLNEHPEATTTVEDGSISTEKLADEAVTPDKTTFFKKITTYANLYDAANAENGRVDCTTGAFTTDAQYWTCPAFPVTPGKNYYVGRANGTLGQDMQSAKHYALYDKDMNPVVQSTPSAKGAWNPIPDGVAYMRVSAIYGTGRNAMMVVEGLDAPTAYVSYADGISVDAGWTDEELRKAILGDTLKHVADNLILSGERLQNNSVSVDKQSGVTVYNLNLVNPNEIVTGVQINTSTGAEQTYQFRDTTGFCTVVPGKRYHAANLIAACCWYDSDKNYLGYDSLTLAQSTYIGFVAPEGAAYLRCSFVSGKSFGISDYGFDWEVAEYGARKVVYGDDLVNDGLNRAINTMGTVSLVKWGHWNLVDESKKIAGNVTDGVFSTIVSGGSFAGYSVDVTPGREYVFIGNNTSPKRVIQYAQDWAYIGTQTINSFGVNNAETLNCLFRFTPADGTAVAFVECVGFVALADEAKDAYLPYLAGNELAGVAKYVPVDLDAYIQAWAVENVLSGYGDKLLQSIHNSKGLKWNCLGDSLTTLNWKNNMYSIVANKLGITPTNYGIVSSTIADYSNDGVTGNPMCVRYAEMSDDADVVTVMGSTNDWATDEKVGTMADRDSTTLYGACHVLFRGLIEKYPNARIGVILPPQNGQGIPSYVESQGGDADMAKMRKKVGIVREVAEYYSLPVCDLFNHGGISGMVESNINRLIQGDYLHITTEGYKVLARPLLAFMRDLIG